MSGKRRGPLRLTAAHGDDSAGAPPRPVLTPTTTIPVCGPIPTNAHGYRPGSRNRPRARPAASAARATCPPPSAARFCTEPSCRPPGNDPDGASPATGVAAQFRRRTRARIRRLRGRASRPTSVPCTLRMAVGTRASAKRLPDGVESVLLYIGALAASAQ